MPTRFTDWVREDWPAYRAIILLTIIALGLLSLAARPVMGVEVLGKSGLKGKCHPVSVLADIPRGDRIGLDLFEMNDIAKSHFRAAGLLQGSDPGAASLIVQTTILGNAYFITSKYRRVVDLGERSYVFAIVWEDTVAGFHGGSPRHVMDVLSDIYDRFIDTYIAENRESCKARGIS